MSTEEKALHAELMRWRDEVAQARFADFEDVGGDVFLHYQLVERIVELAHVHKLKTLEHLYNQTGWCWTSTYGEDVLRIVQKHCSSETAPVLPSPFTRTPLAVNRADQHSPSTSGVVASETTSAHAQHAPRVFTCSSCKATGHRSTLTLH